MYDIALIGVLEERAPQPENDSSSSACEQGREAQVASFSPGVEEPNRFVADDRCLYEHARTDNDLSIIRFEVRTLSR